MGTSEANQPRKKSNRFGWIIAIVVLLILVSTNPTEPQFNEFIKQEIKTEGRSEGGLVSALTDLLAGPVVSLSSTVREDYILFSSYKISIFDEQATYIGILNTFFKVE